VAALIFLTMGVVVPVLARLGFGPVWSGLLGLLAGFASVFGFIVLAQLREWIRRRRK
jgi:hypothetical protein